MKTIKAQMLVLYNGNIVKCTPICYSNIYKCFYCTGAHTHTCPTVCLGDIRKDKLDVIVIKIRKNI